MTPLQAFWAGGLFGYALCAFFWWLALRSARRIARRTWEDMH